MSEPAFISSDKIDELLRVAQEDRIAREIRERGRANLLRWMPGARRAGPTPIGDRSALDEHSGPLPWPKAARVLAIRPDHLGDVLLSGPSLTRLRSGRPDDDITLLTGPWSEAIARRLPGPSALATYPFAAYSRAGRRRIPGRGLLDVLRLSRYIRRGRWDIVIILRDDDFPSAWAAALAGVPIRIGHAEPSVAPFLTHALPESARPAHVTAAGIALVRAALDDGVGEEIVPDGREDVREPLSENFSEQVGEQVAEHGGEEVRDSTAANFKSDPLLLRLMPEDTAGAERFIAELRELGPINPDGPTAIHPGAGAAIKRWTAAGWADVVRAICAPGEPVILSGSEGERSLTVEIARLLSGGGLSEGMLSQHPVLDLTGRTDVGSLAAVYARCRLVLGPDSGPLHLATAVGTRCVSLFGPADPARFGPWGAPERNRAIASDLPCAPCSRLDWSDPDAHPCVRLLSAALVIEAAELLGK